MTEHRVKYIESIPVEEKYIRLELLRQRRMLKLNKERLSNERLEDMIIVYQICIAQIKAVIKALKKQLPVLNSSIWYCDACGNDIDIFGNYCYHCGQKIRRTLYKR